MKLHVEDANCPMQGWYRVTDDACAASVAYAPDEYTAEGIRLALESAGYPSVGWFARLENIVQQANGNGEES